MLNKTDLKTGTRWHMPRSLRKHLKRLPYFLLYNYPKKMATYKKICTTNKKLPPELRITPNVFRSPSSMNELCEYIETWEKENFLWHREYDDTRKYIMNPDIPTDDTAIRREVKILLTLCSNDVSRTLDEYGDRDPDERRSRVDRIYEQYRDKLHNLTGDFMTVVNYAIDVAYSQMNGHQSIAWSMFGSQIIENLKANTKHRVSTMIVEVPDGTPGSCEYLGKHYQLVEGYF